MNKSVAAAMLLFGFVALAGCGSADPNKVAYDKSGYYTGVPYAMPASAPWNAPIYSITPTPDGTGSVIHPAVHDFGDAGWQGWRFWMVATPYHESNDQLENPSIWVSDDGFRWQVPDGLTNPIYPAPPSPRYNSDPDLEYDPDNDRLVLIYRELLEDGSQQTLIATSVDGVTWPAVATPLDWQRFDGNGEHLSPAIVRRDAGDWWIFSVGSDRKLYYHRAADPLGTWDGPHELGTVDFGSGIWGSHLEVIWDGAKFRAILDTRGNDKSDYRAGTWDGSADSFQWAVDDLLRVRWGVGPLGAWDSGTLYRVTFTPHEDGVHYRMWYSASGPESWRIGFTQVPKGA